VFARLSRFVLLLIVAAQAGAAADTASAAGATIIAHGVAPDAVVDRDGVTHLVWNEDRSNTVHQPDVLHYCQVPPGGTACANAKSFVPPSASASNTDFFGPHVMITPFGEVILFTNRCCLVAGRSAPNVLYVSDDGARPSGARPQSALRLRAGSASRRPPSSTARTGAS
jgi:hypothetical protein